MKKLNRKGFILTETLIVATMLVSVLLILYIEFKNVNTNFSESYSYNAIGASYNLYNVKKYVETSNYSAMAEYLKTNDYIDLTSCPNLYFDSLDYCEILFKKLGIKKVIITNENLFPLIENNDLGEDFNKYIRKINYDKSDGYRLIASFDDGSYSSIKVLNGYRFLFILADSCNVTNIIPFTIHHVGVNSSAEQASGTELYEPNNGRDTCGSKVYTEMYARSDNKCYYLSGFTKENFTLVNGGDNQASIIYQRKESSLIIHHYIENTEVEVAPDTFISNFCGNTIYTEQYRKNVSGYMFIDAEEDTVTLTDSQRETNLYYREVH